MAIGGVINLAPPQCQLCDREEILGCSMSAGTATGWIKPTFDGRRGSDYTSLRFRCRSPLFGASQPYWFTGQDVSTSKVRVASDYSDSVPDSSKYVGSQGYHPLEELKDREKKRDMRLTDAEIARTTVEANSKALLVLPGRVHCEPHGHVSWVESQYVIDDYGDIFFELTDDLNILQDRAASNPMVTNVFCIIRTHALIVTIDNLHTHHLLTRCFFQTVIIGTESPFYGDNRVLTSNFSHILDGETSDEIMFVDDYDEIGDTEITDTLIKWGMPETLRNVHPLYFAKCLTKAVHTMYGSRMDCPSNALSIVGFLRPAFIDEVSYIRPLFHHEDDQDYSSDWRDEAEKEEEQVAGMYGYIDGGTEGWNSNTGSNTNSTLHKLEIMTMELLSVYGHRSIISSQDFQDAEPDILAHSASDIIERFNEYGIQNSIALQTLCRKRKGLNVEAARLIGVDRLGMDVRVFSGLEARTLRFSFTARATSESAAEKKIKRMLFPRYQRKNSRTTGDESRDLNS